MANSDNSSPSIRNDLTKIYQQLPPQEKKMVQLFSVIYEPVNRTDFLSCLTPCEIKDENDKAFNSKTLKPYLDNLIDLGVLIQEKGKGPQCHPLLVEIVTRDAIKSDCFELFVKMSQQQLFNNRYVRYGWENWDFLRKVRIAVYRQDFNAVSEEFDEYMRYRSYGYDSVISWDDVVLKIFNNPFDADWLCTFPLRFYESIISSLVSISFQQMINMDAAFNLLYEQCLNQGKYCSDYLRLLLSEQLLLRGKLSETEANLKQISEDYSPNADVFRGWLFFLKGENEKAIASYTQAYQYLQKAKRKKKVYFGTVAGIFFILALLKEGSTKSLKQAQNYANIIAQDKQHWLFHIYRRLQNFVTVKNQELG